MEIPPVIKGRYQYKEVLGKGGMGAVYKAFDTVLKRDVALKTVLDISDPAVLELFHREYEVLAHINHPNIVEILDIGELEVEGTIKPYFIMPLLPGVPLDQLIRTASHRLSVERVVDIISQTCRGLQAAHEKGLVHRDIKPTNIIVMDDDSVKIIDFGVAHVADSKSRTGVKGTLLYMSPEQLQMKPASSQSDIFSLGIVAYESLTGRRPFEGTSEREVADAILHHMPAPASDLNPTVSQTVSRVIHKAMAKQPYHRFAAARDFAETLQKALRNEPIEIFNPARIQPRIQRASKAFEQSDYQFSSEILGELEAEGYIDQEVTLLRLKIDQAIRRKRIQQLLESARTRMEGEEYPLALQKVQEALELDPADASALSLKKSIEAKRSEGRVEDWLRLARQHLEHQAFAPAREALKNVLQTKPQDPRAAQLLSEVDQKERDFRRAQEEKQRLYQAATEAWSRGEVSAALSKMKYVLDLEQRAPDMGSPERSAAYQSFYNQVRSEHDAIQSAYAQGRKLLEDGKFSEALALCEEYVGKFPGLAIFQALKFDVQERQRQALSARIAEIDRQVETEPNLDKRVEILAGALEHYPGEPHFQQALRVTRDKRDLVNSIVAKARIQEERGQFSDALAQWEILRTIYSLYAGLSFEIERLEKRREQQARAEAKARLVKELDEEIAARDYPRALAALEKAAPDFPHDAELVELERLIRQGLERTKQALVLMVLGQELASQGHYEEGLEALRKAHGQDDPNPAIRQVLLDTLVERARVLVEEDWRAAEPLLAEALDLDPSHSLAKSLRTLAQDRKRGEFVERMVAQARRAQASGDLQGALTQVREAMTSYGTDPRLTQLQATLANEFQEAQRRQARHKDLDDLRDLGKQAEAASNLPTLAAIASRIQDISARHGDDAEFQSTITQLQPRVAARMAAFEKAPLKVSAVPPTPPQATVSPSAVTVQSPGQVSLLRTKGEQRDAGGEYEAGEAGHSIASVPPDLREEAERPATESPGEFTSLFRGSPREKGDQERDEVAATPAPLPGTVPPTPVTPPPSEVSPGLATAVIGPVVARGGAPASPRPPVQKPVIPARAPAPEAAPEAIQPPVVSPPLPGEEAARKTPLTWIVAGLAALMVVVAGIYFYRTLGHPPVTATLNATLGTVEKGQSTTLSWTTANATEISLEPGVGKVQAQGSTAVTPQQSTTYTLTATGPSGTKTETTLVTVSAVTQISQGLRISTDLQAGEILLDGKKGQLEGGQFSRDDITPGKHSLAISGGGSQAQINFELTPGSLPQVIGPVKTRGGIQGVVVSTLAREARIDSSYTTQASLDDRAVGEVGSNPLPLKGQEAGTHKLVLGKGEEARTLDVEFGPAPLLTVHLMTPNRTVGDLLITTGEDQVTVFLDDKKYPRTTKSGRLRIPDLDPRTHKIAVQKDGFQNPAPQQVQILKGQEAKLSFHLVAIPTVASLGIEGALPDTQVSLDGIQLGTVGADGSFNAPSIRPGEHTVELRKETYKPKKLSRQFTAGQPVHLAKNDVTLEAAVSKVEVSPRLALARLVVSTLPGAQVSIDGKPSGNADSKGRLAIEGAQPGQRSVQVSLAGYQDYKQVVTLAAGSDITLPAGLLCEITVYHKHTLGECSGRLRVGRGRIQYLTTNKGHAFDAASSSVVATGSADFGKHFYIDIRGARRYVFGSEAPTDDLKRLQSVLAQH
jgi:serine/threonine protein kinase